MTFLNYCLHNIYLRKKANKITYSLVIVLPVNSQARQISPDVGLPHIRHFPMVFLSLLRYISFIPVLYTIDFEPGLRSSIWFRNRLTSVLKASAEYGHGRLWKSIPKMYANNVVSFSGTSHNGLTRRIKPLSSSPPGLKDSIRFKSPRKTFMITDCAISSRL